MDNWQEHKALGYINKALGYTVEKQEVIYFALGYARATTDYDTNVELLTEIYNKYYGNNKHRHE